MNNLETTVAIYEAFAKGDVPFILGCLAERVAWESWHSNHAQIAGVPYLSERTDAAGVAEFFGETAKLGIKRAEVLAIMDGGDKIAVEFEIETERFGFEQEMHLWTYNDEGKVVAFRHYLDTAKHIAANERTNAVTS